MPMHASCPHCGAWLEAWSERPFAATLRCEHGTLFLTDGHARFVPLSRPRLQVGHLTHTYPRIAV